MEGRSAEGVNFDDDRKMIVAPRIGGGGSMGVLLVVMLGSLGALLLRGVGCGVRVWGVRIFGWGFRAGSLVCFVS